MRTAATQSKSSGERASWIETPRGRDSNRFRERPGSVDVAARPDQERDQMQDCREILGGFPAAREVTPIAFDLVEETLNDSALFVDVSVIGMRSGAVEARRDERFHLLTAQKRSQVIGIIPLVDDQCPRRGGEPGQGLRLAGIGCLSACEHERQGMIRRIGERVKLGTDAPASPAPRCGENRHGAPQRNTRRTASACDPRQFQSHR